MIIESKEHKELVGKADGKPYHVVFDADGLAEVEQAVGEQLLQLSIVAEVQTGSTVLEDMSVAQLRVYAKEKGITLGQARTKDDIIRVIKGFEDNAGNTDEGGNVQGDAE